MDGDGIALMTDRKKPRGSLPPKTVAFRVSGAYGKWLDKLARANRSSLSGLMDQALVAYARTIGFTEEPPER
jgi:hypothetical protein